MSCVKECNVPDVTHNRTSGCYASSKYLILTIQSTPPIPEKQRTEYILITNFCALIIICS